MRGADFDIMSSQRDRRSLDKIKHCGVDGVLFLPHLTKSPPMPFALKPI